MNLKKEQDPAEKRREYMRLYQQERRAKERREKLTGGGSKLKSSRSVTRRRTSTVLVPENDDLLALDEVYRLGYEAGATAITKAAEAMKDLQVRDLSVSDLKRLVETGVRLLEVCSPALGEEVDEEESLIFTDEMLGDDDAIDAVDQILTISAKKTEQIGDRARELTEGRGSGQELPGGICEGSQ